MFIYVCVCVSLFTCGGRRDSFVTIYRLPKKEEIRFYQSSQMSELHRMGFSSKLPPFGGRGGITGLLLSMHDLDSGSRVFGVFEDNSIVLASHFRPVVFVVPQK